MAGYTKTIPEYLAEVAYLEAQLAEAKAEAAPLRAALEELCRGHNARGSDGPCDCVGCRLLDSSNAGKGWLEVREQLEKQVAGQKRTLHKLKGKWDKSQLRVKELEGLMAGVGVEAMDEACAALDAMEAE